MPSARIAQNSRAAQRATAGASVARSGVIPKKGALGNSCARAAIFHVSSPLGFATPPFPLVLRAASASGEPTSTSAASTRIRRIVAENSAASRVAITRHLRFGNAERTSDRARSRGAKVTIVRSSLVSTATVLDTGGGHVETWSSLYELADDGVFRLLDLFHGSDLTNLSFVEHGNPRADSVGAAHVVRDDNAGHAELLPCADHQLVYHCACHRVETG